MAVEVLASIADCTLSIETDGDPRNLEHVQAIVMQAVSGVLEMQRGVVEMAELDEDPDRMT